MAVYEADRDSPLELAEPIDYRAKRFYGFTYRPGTWADNTVYLDGDTVIPTTFKGRYYSVAECGKSGAIEPTDWSIADGTVEWTDNCYDMLPIGVTITDSAWAANNVDIVLTNNFFDDISTRIMVDELPDDITDFILTNHTTFSNGEEEYRSMQIVVATT